MDPPDPCKGQVQHRPVTPTDVVAHPQPVNVHGICKAPAPTYWHLVAALLVRGLDYPSLTPDLQVSLQDLHLQYHGTYTMVCPS